jgi:anti-anti-sigma factor
VTKPLVLRGGYYDISRRAEFRAELDSVEPHSDVVLDLSGTEYLDCASVGVMVEKLRQWREHTPGTNLRLTNVNPDLARMLRLLELHPDIRFD